MPDTEHANPPAFPNPGYYPDDPQERLDPRERMEYSSRPERGLSLRDYFAAAALPGIIMSADEAYRWDKRPDSPTLEEYANDAYRVADALLKAKEGRS